MSEHIPYRRVNIGIPLINLVSDNQPSFSIELTQDKVVKVVSTPVQLKKSVSVEEGRSIIMIQRRGPKL